MREHEGGRRRSEFAVLAALHLMMMPRLGSDGQKVCVSVMKRVATEAGARGNSSRRRLRFICVGRGGGRRQSKTTPPRRGLGG